MSGEVLGWDAWAGDTGIKHANAVELGAPESAIARVLERAVQKYGRQDWTIWEFRAEPIPRSRCPEIRTCVRACDRPASALPWKTGLIE